MSQVCNELMTTGTDKPINMKTEIPCPTCGSKVVHRYDCTCDTYWKYCKNDKCVTFFCERCDEEQKVSWDDEPDTRKALNSIEYGRVVLTAADEEAILAEYEKGDEFDALSEPKWSEKENQAIMELLMNIATPGCGYEEELREKGLLPPIQEEETEIKRLSHNQNGKEVQAT